MKRFAINTITIMTLALGVGSVACAASLDVLTVESERQAGEVLFSGTADTGVLAVTCSLINVGGDEAMLNSVEVESGEFSGTFAVSASDSFASVMCANYDGGAIVTAEVVGGNVVIPKAPNTGIVE